MTSISPHAALFERALRTVRAIEAENARLKAELELDRGNNGLLRMQVERLERELGVERDGRGELVEQVIDWLAQGEEIVRDGVAKVRERALSREDGRERPGVAQPPEPRQTARAEVRSELAGNLDSSRERFGAREFARTFGGAEETEESAPGEDLAGKA